ncbi:MAG TPA: ester cyclase [Rubrobacteraceae bacterium]|nr:ester cyclase [Rubrobacteraceae bacterium]
MGAVATLLSPLLLPPVVVAVLLGLAALDAWLFFVHGLGEGLKQILYRPELFIMLFGLTALSGVFHEFGHAAASRYGGARPGAIGVGIYLVWPVFYADVTDTYRLGRSGRLRADLGGVYFNAVFSLLVAAAYFATGAESLLVLVLLQQIEILHQFLPFLMLDGYYVVSDVTGVPNLFGRIKPIIKSMVPGRAPDERVSELKPWVRVVVTAWVLMVIPALLGLFGILAVSAPLIIATTWESAVIHYSEAREAFGVGSIIGGIAGLLRLVLLIVPLAGMFLMFALVGKRLGSALLNRSRSKYVVPSHNETLVGLYFRNLYGGENPGSANQIIATDCVLHDPGALEEACGIGGIKHYIDTCRDALGGDIYAAFKSTAIEGDKVTVRWTYGSARDGKGAAPGAGDEPSVRVTSFRIAGGKIAEIWEGYDVLGESQPSNECEEGQETLPSLKVIAGAVGAYIFIPAILLYPVGLVAFALQLSVSQQIGLPAAWYAASLVPSTIVLGQAITLLLIPLYACFAVALAAAHFRVWRRLEMKEVASRMVEKSTQRTRRMRLSVAGAVLLLVATAVVVLWFVPVPLFPGFSSTLSLTLALLVGWFSGTLIANDYVLFANRPRSTVLLGKHWMYRGIEERWIFRGLWWVYLGSGLGAILSVLAVAASGQGSDLPRVMMNFSGEGAEKPNEAPPLLLSHSGGYWHILNSEENAETEDGALSSVPDSEAGEVVVIDDPVADLSLAVEVPRDGVAWANTQLSYELEVANNGPDAAPGVELAYEVPKDAALVSFTTSRGLCDGKVADDTRSVECALGALPDEGTATVRVKIEPQAAGNMLGKAEVKSEGFDHYEGNSRQANALETRLDTIGPDIRSTLLPRPNPRGWNERDVIVDLKADDREGSGVEEIIYSASGAQEIEEKTLRGASAEVRVVSEGVTTIHYSAKDATGNMGEKDSVTVGIDKTAPQIRCDVPEDPLQRKKTSIPCTAKDSMSGLGDPADANFLLSTEYARGRNEDEKEGGNALTSRQICDAAMNCRTVCPIGGINIDSRPSVTNPAAPPNDAEYELQEQAEAGVDECKGSLTNGYVVDTSSVGSKVPDADAEEETGNGTSEFHRYGVLPNFISGTSMRNDTKYTAYLEFTEEGMERLAESPRPPRAPGRSSDEP